jgi:NADH-quinone oxidoreductase subunit C
MQLTNKAVAETLQSVFGAAIQSTEETYGMTTLTVSREKLYEIMQYLRDKQGFNFLTDVCGIHIVEEGKPEQLGTVYHVHNWVENVRVRVKTFFPKDNPVVATVTSLWASANWQERETYDFYGIIFEGHPDLRRILNIDEMDFFPLRKEYPLEEQTRTDKKDEFFGR